MPHTDLFESLADGATLVTVNERLARDLRLAYGLSRQAAGEGAWERPRIIGWQSWLNSSHAALADAALAGAEPPPPLLDPPRAQVFWEQLIAAAPGAEQLMQPAAAARLAADAWALSRSHGIDIARIRAQGGPDAVAFAGWAEAYAARLAATGWLDPADLPDLIAAAIRERRLAVPARMVLAGFDELTPAQVAVLDALRAQGCAVSEHEFVTPGSGAPHRVALADAEAEVGAAARWARARLTANPTARIGVVVPDLADRRHQLARVFAAELAPAAAGAPQPAPMPFNISLGRPLDDYPVVDAACLILELVSGRVPITQLGRLLRSPFLGESERERNARAALDARLRESGGASAGVQWLATLAAEQAPALARRLQAWIDWRAGLPRSQRAGAWADALAHSLRELGWPGERSLDSAEHQTVRAFHGALAQFADLDDWLGPLSLSAAAGHLRRSLHERVFQPESAPTGVQILGTLEAAGQEFDHLWVMGLHDGVWPPSPRPHPLLPARLQRDLHLPHASAERELRFARRVTGRLLVAAPEVVVSWPQREGDAQLRVSPLLAAVPEIACAALALAAPADWRTHLGPAHALECIDDEQAPPLPAAATRGGTALLRDQAACPFRAFARHRLGAEALVTPAAGLDPAERGKLMHRALELIWAGLGDHARLEAATEAELRQAAERAAERAVAESARARPDVFTPALTALESARIAGLITAWLELERARAPFTVIERELDARVPVGGLELRTRVDRIDRLADGSLAVIDYKTGKVSERSWFGERPDEPQLPLYACAVGAELGAVLFAQVRADEMRFRGVSREEDQLPGVTSLAQLKSRPEDMAEWPDLVARWSDVLASLARDYRAGVARVDPKTPDTCTYCHLASLCRISERRGDGIRDEEGEDD